jgi:hypothetical protein
MACVALRDQLRRDGGPMSPKRWQMSEDRVVKQLQQPSPMQVMVSTLTGHDHKLKGKLLAPRGDTPTPATGATLLHALSTWLRGAQGVAGDSRNQAECAALGFEEASPSLPASQPPSLPASPTGSPWLTASQHPGCVEMHRTLLRFMSLATTPDRVC